LITDSYHSEKESLFSPGVFLGERKSICDTAIATFSCDIFNSVLEKYPHKEVAHVGSANGSKPVYMLEINGKNVVFYLSAIGGCLAGNDIIEINWQTGIKNLIIFGSAGSLDSKATDGRFVIPTQAYRDEGMSYHYACVSLCCDYSITDRPLQLLCKYRTFLNLFQKIFSLSQRNAILNKYISSSEENE